MLEQLRSEMVAVTRSGHFLVGLSLALTIPDIAGALNSVDGRATKARYIEWFDAWASPRFASHEQTSFTGAAAYQFRCRLLHQGRVTMPSDGSPQPYSRLLFAAGGPVRLHMTNLMGNYFLDVPTTVLEIMGAFEEWENACGQDDHVRRNAAQTAELHPNGWPPLVVGVPVIG